eukprot:TRINITY_DN27037_c0_g1_i1.p1 TRINITY_DN27037_c0_g1~~TRINITY_DN27037_c0_g1_i1.p1  ORF type:complete len:200 (+),score=47.53 TRINITY_DN27037_c0_g1_i1:62-601(+)
MEDGELNDLGREQAVCAAKRVAKLHLGESVAAFPTSLVVSSAKRTRQTAEPFIDILGLEPTYDDDLRECFPCPVNDRTTTRSPEDLAAAHRQAESAFSRLFRRPRSSSQNEVVVVITHANVIRYWTLRALQLPPDAWTLLSIPHCSITHVKITPSGNVSVRCIGDAGFHTPSNVTTRNL